MRKELLIIDHKRAQADPDYLLVMFEKLVGRAPTEAEIAELMTRYPQAKS
jgi:hypothetical protein